MNNKEFLIQEGFYHQETFTNYERLEASSHNWSHDCTYQLIPNALQGNNKLLQLNTSQLSFTNRYGGIMQNVSSPHECLSVVTIEECEDKMCLNHKIKKRFYCYP